MMMPDAPAGTGEGRPTVTYRSVRNATPTQSNSSKDEGPNTFDRYTDTPSRAASLHRGTAYNILRTLQAEGFVGYDEPTRSYSVSLHILELAYGVLRRRSPTPTLCRIASVGWVSLPFVRREPSVEAADCA